MKVISSIENLFCFFQEPGYIVGTELPKVKSWVTLGNPGKQNQAVILAGWSTSSLPSSWLIGGKASPV